MIKHIILTVTFIVFYSLMSAVYADKYFVLGLGHTVFKDRCADGVWCYNDPNWPAYKDYKDVSGRMGIGGYWSKKWGWEAAYSNLGKVSLVSEFPSDSDSLSCKTYECNRLWVASGLGKIQGVEGSLLRYFKVTKNINLYVRGGAYLYKGYWKQYKHLAKGIAEVDEVSYNWTEFYRTDKYGVVPIVGLGGIYKNTISFGVARYGLGPVTFTDRLGTGGIDTATTLWANVRIPL